MFLGSMYEARYGSEETHPVFDPVLHKWDGKESLAVAHNRMAREAELIDIEGLEVIVPGLEIVEANYVPPQSSLKRKGSELVNKIGPKKVCAPVDVGLGVDIGNGGLVVEERMDELDTVDVDGLDEERSVVLDDVFEQSKKKEQLVVDGTDDDEDDGKSIELDDEFVQRDQNEEGGQDQPEAVTENEEVTDTIELSKGWIKSVIFDREWKEPSAKVQLISRIKVNNLVFLRIFDGSDNTGQCCVAEEAVISWLDSVPDNSVLEVLEASLENGSRIVLKKVESLMVLQKPLSDDLEANFLKKQFFIDYFRSKGLLREDGADIRKDCPEYQPSPIKMRTRSKAKTQLPPHLPQKNYLRGKQKQKRTVFDCQDCGKSFKSEAPLVKHMEMAHAAGFL